MEATGWKWGGHVRFRVHAAVVLLFALWFTVLWPARIVRADHTPQHSADMSRSRYELGRMYEQAGDLTRAEEYYRSALELWPDNTPAREALQRLLAGQNPRSPLWDWFSWLPGYGSGKLGAVMQLIGWSVMLILLLFVFVKMGTEAIRLTIQRARGIPLLGLGQIKDPTGHLPGLLHQLATDMNDAGLTIYDEKGAALPDFNFIGDAGFAEAKLVIRLLELVYARQVQRINVDMSQDDGLLNAAVSLTDSGNGYVRYLHVVTVDPACYKGPGELTKLVAQMVANAILIALSRSPNTRGLLYQRIGDWSSALREFLRAADEAKARGKCLEYYQAFLNLGNLYSFLGMQDKSVAAYSDVAEKAQNPRTLALLQAAMACSYKNWELASPPDQQGTYEWLAQQAIGKALGSGAKSPLVCYTIACYYSLSTQIEECLVWLREAVAGDLAYLEYAQTDPDMETLRQWLGARSLGEALGLRVG
jgi:tetratricopeptide (TPR) repeat protein